MLDALREKRAARVLMGRSRRESTALLQPAFPNEPVVRVSEPSRYSWAVFAVLAAVGLVCALIASSKIDPGSGSVLALTTAATALAIAVTAYEAYARSGRLLRIVIVSPLALAAVFWLAIFVMRPLELLRTPDHAAGTVSQIGFQLHDLTIAAALGGVGVAAWCAAYLWSLRHAPWSQRKYGAIWQPAPLSTRRALLLLAFGTFLWGALFLRQGGPSALIDSPVEIREGQNSSFYGFVGVWLTQGVALYAFAVYLKNKSKEAKRIMLIGAPLAVAAGVSLQLRGLAVSLFLLGAIVYLRIRTPKRRTALIVLVIALLAVPVLAFAGQVRSHTRDLSTREAIEVSLDEPGSNLFISELATFDNLVAIRQLVPSTIAYLDGGSLLEVFTALVPRGLWPEKPLSIDQRVTNVFFTDAPAGSPIAMQGELYINLGLVGVILGALVLGAIAGAVARFTLLVAAGGALLVLNSITIFWMYTFLRDGFANAFSNLVMAFMGAGLAVYVLGTTRDLSPRALLRDLSPRGWRGGPLAGGRATP